MQAFVVSGVDGTSKVILGAFESQGDADTFVELGGVPKRFPNYEIAEVSNAFYCLYGSRHNGHVFEPIPGKFGDNRRAAEIRRQELLATGEWKQVLVGISTES